MSISALALILVAALFHALWNFQAKKSRNKLAFVWLFQLAGLGIFLPAFIWWFEPGPLTWSQWWPVLATGVIHAFYFGFLSQAYDRGDLSMVYPIARGTGPCLVAVLAVLLLGERISLQAGLGIGAITVGIGMLHLPHGRGLSDLKAALGRDGASWALLTGMTSALYSLVDKVGVSYFHPVVYVYLLFLGSWLFMTAGLCVAGHMPRGLAAEWEANRKNILVVGGLCMSAYLMVLFAMARTQVSYVVPLRETGILFSVGLGLIFLKERLSARRCWGAVLVFLGIAAMGMSH